MNAHGASLNLGRYYVVKYVDEIIPSEVFSGRGLESSSLMLLEFKAVKPERSWSMGSRRKL